MILDSRSVLDSVTALYDFDTVSTFYNVNCLDIAGKIEANKVKPSGKGPAPGRTTAK